MKTKFKLILSALLMASTFVYAAGAPDIDNSTVEADPVFVPEYQNSSDISINLKDTNGFPVRHAHFSILVDGDGELVDISDVKEIGFRGNYTFTATYSNNSNIDIVKTISITANGEEITSFDIIFKAYK